MATKLQRRSTSSTRFTCAPLIITSLLSRASHGVGASVRCPSTRQTQDALALKRLWCQGVGHGLASASGERTRNALVLQGVHPEQRAIRRIERSLRRASSASSRRLQRLTSMSMPWLCHSFQRTRRSCSGRSAGACSDISVPREVLAGSRRKLGRGPLARYFTVRYLALEIDK